MTGGKYPKSASEISIEFVDGKVKTYEIDASPGIIHHLMREANATGFLVVRNGLLSAVAIPIEMIRDVEMRATMKGDKK